MVCISLFYIERMFSQCLALVFKETKSSQSTFNYQMYVFTNNNVVIKQHAQSAKHVCNYPNIPYFLCYLFCVFRIPYIRAERFVLILQSNAHSDTHHNVLISTSKIKQSYDELVFLKHGIGVQYQSCAKFVVGISLLFVLKIVCVCVCVCVIFLMGF